MWGKKSTHRGVYTRRKVHTGRAHMEEYIRRRAHTKKCIHGKSTNGKSIHEREHIWRSSVHTEEKVYKEYTRKRAHTKECTYGESTRRSIHGESAHGGVHTGGAKYGKGRATWRSTPPCEVYFIFSSIQLQWAKFSDGIFYAIVSM